MIFYCFGADEKGWWISLLFNPSSLLRVYTFLAWSGNWVTRMIRAALVNSGWPHFLFHCKTLDSTEVVRWAFFVWILCFEWIGMPLALLILPNNFQCPFQQPAFPDSSKGIQRSLELILWNSQRHQCISGKAYKVVSNRYYTTPQILQGSWQGSWNQV